jgi:diguanylate cyclase
MHALIQRLSTLLFTDDRRRRSSLMLALLGALLMAYSGIVGLYAAGVARAPAPVVWAWAATSTGVMVLAYLANRMGWTRGMPDPALTLLQLIFTVTSSAVAYSILGPVRGAVFPVLMVITVFGVMSLLPRTMAKVSAYVVVLYGGVMAFKAMQEPTVYPLGVEIAHFLMLSVMVSVVPLLSMRYASLRAQQARSQQDLIRVQELASRDELTGLVNRRQMTQLLQRAQAARARSGRPFCVAVLDLDHFKRINDHYGHAAGDEVLRRVAEAAKSAVRDHDVIARWGGEEFVLLLGDSKLSSAQAGVERLRQHIESMVMHVGNHTMTMTVSAGLAEPLEGESFERALSRADHALYVAKARGRNAVVTATAG